VAEIKDVTIWAQAADDCGTRRCVNGLALGANGGLPNASTRSRSDVER